MRIGGVGYIFHLGHLHENYQTYCMLSGSVFSGQKMFDVFWSILRMRHNWLNFEFGLLHGNYQTYITL